MLEKVNLISDNLMTQSGMYLITLILVGIRMPLANYNYLHIKPKWIYYD